jgi:hypothetical protein
VSLFPFKSVKIGGVEVVAKCARGSGRTGINVSTFPGVISVETKGGTATTLSPFVVVRNFNPRNHQVYAETAVVGRQSLSWIQPPGDAFGGGIGVISI